jgi:hypothetical protein
LAVAADVGAGVDVERDVAEAAAAFPARAREDRLFEYGGTIYAAVNMGSPEREW